MILNTNTLPFPPWMWVGLFAISRTFLHTMLISLTNKSKVLKNNADKFRADRESLILIFYLNIFTFKLGHFISVIWLLVFICKLRQHVDISVCNVRTVLIKSWNWIFNIQNRYTLNTTCYLSSTWYYVNHKKMLLNSKVSKSTKSKSHFIFFLLLSVNKKRTLNLISLIYDKNIYFFQFLKQMCLLT